MHKKLTYKLFALLMMVGLVLGLAVNGTHADDAPANAEQGTDKVESAVLDAISKEGGADFVIEMAEHADLSAAYEIKDWSERGWYVYNTLKEVAERTQKPIIGLLEKQGVKYQSFYAGNEIFVTGGSYNTLTTLGSLKSVAYIRSPRNAHIDPLAPLSFDVVNFNTQSLGWGITDTKADQFWSTFDVQGDRIVVANIDTGVQWDHPALDQAYKCGTNPSDPNCWYDPSNICKGTMCDNMGHGTHTMGTMVGDDDPTLTYQVGMAPNAQWIACKGCESNDCSETALNACADWILAPNGDPDNRPNIVNNSWGGDGGNDWYLSKVEAWRAAGIFPAFSAGNSGPTCGSLGSPGDYQESIGTAAHDSGRTIAYFSSRGPGYFGDEPYTKPNISAPGVNILSSLNNGNWGYKSGTSMASPHSAGAVALLWSCNSSLIGDIDGTFQLLQDTADAAPAGSCGTPADGEGNYTYGYGYLNVLEAGDEICDKGKIVGKVTSSGSPLKGALVIVNLGEEEVARTRTDADGNYQLYVPAGTYYINATKYEYERVGYSEKEVIEGETLQLDFEIQYLGKTLVSGYVSDGGIEGGEVHGYPLYAAIHITSADFDQTVYSDPITGHYEIELAADTDHTFTTTPVVSGYIPKVETITPSGENFTYDIQLNIDAEACSAPGYQPDYDFFWSFEQSDGGFTTNGGTNSSWAWGNFTSGPGEGHSGTKGIATNPAGNYNSNELGYMLSPVIDLIGFGTDTPAIQWWDWKDIESASYDWARVDVTKDGGTTWTTVWGPEKRQDNSYHSHVLVLDPSYKINNFQFRFSFHSNSTNVAPGWYIDDVGIFEAVADDVIAVPCVVIPGGAVAGFVSDANTGDPLIGADVYSDTAATQSFALENDPDNAGFYWLFQPTTTDPEYVEFTAHKDMYADETATVSVAQDDLTHRQDFGLGTGELTFDPTEFDFTMAMGDAPATDTLTIGNDGSGEATFELVEKDEGFTPLNIPAFTGELPEDNREVSLGRAPEATTNVSRASSTKNDLGGILSTAPAFAMDVYPGENLVYIPDTTVPGTWEVVGSITGLSFFGGDFVSGDFSTIYAVNYDNNNLYAVDTTDGSSTLIGPSIPPAGNWTGLSGTPDGVLYGLTSVCGTSTNLVTVDIETGTVTNLGSLQGVTCGIDLAYNTDDEMIYIVDIVTDHLFRVDPVSLAATDVGSLGVDANYAQGMDFEEESGVLYWAAYNNSTSTGELRVLDMTTGNSSLIGTFPGGAEVDCLAFPTGGSADVPWLSEGPVSGTVPAGETVEVTITVDPSGLGQPGDYTAALKVKHNTPYTYANIPVTLHLAPPAGYGTVKGTVTGLEACDVNPAPIEGATINFKQGEVIKYTTTTLADGYYSFSMPAGEYDIEVIAEGFVSQTVTGVDVAGGSMLTQDFELRLLAPCLSAVPMYLEKGLVVGQTGTKILSIVNTGAIPADIELFEAGAEITSTLVSEGFEAGEMPPTGWETIHLGDTSREWTIVDAVTYPDFVYEGAYAAWINYDSSYDSDEWLLTPVIDSSIVTDLTLTFYAESDTEYPTATMKLWVTDEDGVPLTEEPIWDMVRDESWSDFEYRLITVDLSDFDEYGAIRVAWQYVGLDGESFGLDNIEVSGNVDVPWLSEDPVAGTVPAGGSLPITVTFDATGLSVGDYFAGLRVRPDGAPKFDVPVTLHVVEFWKLYLPLIAK